MRLPSLALVLAVSGTSSLDIRTPNTIDLGSVDGVICAVDASF